MATVTGLTAERMIAIEGASVVDGTVVGDNLILTRFDTTTIDAGSVRGPTGSPGITSGELADEIENAFLLNAPVGSILEYISDIVPNALWVFMTGQTIVGGQSLYPIFWSIIPAAMKSGSNIIMPNTKGKVSIGLDPADTDFNAINKTGGSKVTQLPSHFHTQPAHAHDLQNHQHVAPSHTHGFNVNTNTTGAHVHVPYTGGAFAITHGSTVQTTYVEGAGGTSWKITGDADAIAQTTSDGAHAHNVAGSTDAGSSAGWTQGPNINTTGNGGNQNTDSAGVTLTSVSNVPPYIVFAKMIKVA